MAPQEWLFYIVAFTTSFSISLLTTPFAKKMSVKLGAIDYPKKRGLHNEPIPRMGGIAIVLGFLVSMIILIPFINELRTIQFLGFLVGASIIVVLGMLDDVYNLNSKLKLSVQIVAALVVVYTGTRINVVMWPFSTYIGKFSVPITVVWIIGVTNAVNLIDGVDGLAAGVSSICAIFLTILCILTGSPMAVVFTVAIAGSCLGFLPRNFNPAEVYMGDTGATFLGYTLAVSSIMGVFKLYTLLAVLVAVLAMALPIIDTAFAMIRRALKGKPIMTADRGHLHHILIDKGYSQKQAVFILYAISIATGSLSIIIAFRDFHAILITFLFLIMLLLMVYVYTKRVNKEN